MNFNCYFPAAANVVACYIRLLLLMLSQELEYYSRDERRVSERKQLKTFIKKKGTWKLIKTSKFSLFLVMMRLRRQRWEINESEKFLKRKFSSLFVLILRWENKNFIHWDVRKSAALESIKDLCPLLNRIAHKLIDREP